MAAHSRTMIRTERMRMDFQLVDGGRGELRARPRSNQAADRFIFRTQLYGTAFRSFVAVDQDVAWALARLRTTLAERLLGRAGDFSRGAGCWRGKRTPPRVFGALLSCAQVSVCQSMPSCEAL